MPLEIPRDGQRIGTMSLHAQRQRLDATQDQIGIERTEHPTGCAAQQVQLPAQFGIGSHDDSAQHIGVTAQVLGRANA
jgi:hypothetical protein